MSKFAPLNLTAEEIIAFTPLWAGPRSDDGRPRVDDKVIARLKNVSITQAWGVLITNHHRYQFEGGWQRIFPEETLCGRAMTAVFMPQRPDLKDTIGAKAAAAGQVGDITSWPIYALERGDIYVADVFGKIEWGPVIGDNLATAIYARTGCGVVHNAAVRDIDGIEKVGNFASFIRGVHPTYANQTVAMVGINCPVRVGGVTIMPGDVILGQRDGVLVIPPHLAELVATTCEIMALRDQFGKQCLKDGVYLPGQIDRKWSDDIEAHFLGWLDDYPEELPVAKEQMKEFLKGRTW
jgi:4-hydroxy-4-methyl-2-oxoglutarate aldolase